MNAQTSSPAAVSPVLSEFTASDTTRWFKDEVLPHEGKLRAFLRSQYSSLRDVDDLIQETYSRIIQLRSRTPVRAPRALLFTLARNTALSQIRRGKIISFEELPKGEHSSVMEEGMNAADHASREQEIAVLREGIAALPERCRQAVVLRKIHGLSHEEIARRLGLSEKTIGAHITHGIVRLRAFLIERGVTQAPFP